MKKALIIVDVQNDFVTGSLAVPNAKEIIPVIRWMVDNVKYTRIVGTFDWHPENHISFKQWPTHCVQYSDGAKSAIYPLAIYPLENKLNLLVYKGQSMNVDSYSAFFDSL